VSFKLGVLKMNKSINYVDGSTWVRQGKKGTHTAAVWKKKLLRVLKR
jgi:hypothetical protein